VTISAVGSAQQASGSGGPYSVTMSSLAVGDLIVILASESSGQDVSGITGGGVATWGSRIAVSPTEGASQAELFAGVIGATTPTTLTATMNIAGLSGIIVQQFHDSAGGAWTVGTTGTIGGTSSAGGTYPNLTGGPLYVGGIRCYGIPSGSTAGYTYVSGTGSNNGSALVYGLNVSGLNDPAWAQSPASVYTGLAVLLGTAPGSGGNIAMLL